MSQWPMAAAARQRRLQAVIVHILSSVLPEPSGRKTTLLFRIPAAGRSWPGKPGCTARYAARVRHYGE
ncbi:hypothetical protein [Morganella morganii]|uniref:hypothetical protein n=1 Tax=Morganella morganii TaxID=582 RepID=UPI0032DAED75